MRKSMIIACAVSAFMLSSCKVAEVAETPVQSSEMSFVCFDGDAATRTALNEDGTIFWTPGDEINVFRGVAGSGKFVTDATEPCAVAHFAGSVKSDPGTGDFWAVQPYAATNVSDGSSVTLSVQSAQTAKAGSFAPGMFPSVAKSDGEALAFFNVCGGLRFTVTKPGVKTVIFRSNGGEKLAGKVKVTMGEDGKPVSEVLEGTSTVSLCAPSGETLSVGEWYYISLLPGTLSAGFTVSLTTATQETQISRSTAVTVKRSTFGQLEAIDRDSEYTDKGISILAIGNSFSVDAMEYLFPILQQAGYSKIYLGNLYIGGCSLETHAGNIASNASSYTYYTNTNGTWSNRSSGPVTAMDSRQWDYVSIQQVSQNSGMPETFDPYLGQVVAAVKEHCPGARIMWHMTWAYQSGSTHSGFANYGKSQSQMYNAIVNAAKSRILTDSSFDFVIPSGTAVQNLRTSFLGDVLTRDGYHMSYNNGRLATAMMWAKQITGCDLNDITYTPSSYRYTPRQIAAIKEAVENAYKNPFAVTRSTVDGSPEGYAVSEELKQMFTATGRSLDQYEALPMVLIPYAFYNSGVNSTITSVEAGSTDGTALKFAASRIFGKAEIPVGSVIVLKSGFQYRPEGWTALNAKNSSRPGNITTPVVEVTDTWWGSFKFRAFNVARTGTPTLSFEEVEELQDVMAVFVPKAKTPDQIFTEAGYSLSDYEKLDLGLTPNAYWLSSSHSNILPSESNSNQFSATRIFTREEIPAGSVIVVSTYCQYRPDAWISLDEKNTARPGNVTASLTVVNDAWWGSFNYRGFNIAAQGNPPMPYGELAALGNKFAIYVPKK